MGIRVEFLRIDEETLELFARLYDEPGTPAMRRPGSPHAFTGTSASTSDSSPTIPAHWDRLRERLRDVGDVARDQCRQSGNNPS